MQSQVKMSNCKIALKDRTETSETFVLQIHISAPHISSVLLFHTSTAFRISSVKIEINAYLVPTRPQTDDLHLLVSFGRSPNTIVAASAPPHPHPCRRQVFTLHQTPVTPGHCVPSDSFSVKRCGPPGLKGGPCSQPDSAYDVFTELSGHHSFPVEEKNRVVPYK